MRRSGSEIDLTPVAPDLRHENRLWLIAALDALQLSGSLDLSLHHKLPEHIARIARRLAA